MVLLHEAYFCFVKPILFYFLLFSFSFAQAQQFGGEPSSVKWKQVNTDTVRIIFPARFG